MVLVPVVVGGAEAVAVHGGAERGESLCLLLVLALQPLRAHCHSAGMRQRASTVCTAIENSDV